MPALVVVTRDEDEVVGRVRRNRPKLSRLRSHGQFPVIPDRPVMRPVTIVTASRAALIVVVVVLVDREGVKQRPFAVGEQAFKRLGLHYAVTDRQPFQLALRRGGHDEVDALSRSVHVFQPPLRSRSQTRCKLVASATRASATSVSIAFLSFSDIDCASALRRRAL